jgi:hypothetical protein
MKWNESKSEWHVLYTCKVQKLTTKTLACFLQGGHMGVSIVYSKTHNVASLSLTLSFSLKEQTNKFTNNS